MFRGEQLYVNMEYSLIELISEFKVDTLNIFLFRKTIRRKKIISANKCHQNQTPNDSGGIYNIFKGRRELFKINIIYRQCYTHKHTTSRLFLHDIKILDYTVS